MFSVLWVSVFQLVFQKLFEDFALRWCQIISLIFVGELYVSCVSN